VGEEDLGVAYPAEAFSQGPFYFACSLLNVNDSVTLESTEIE
jgi:hypothetical protein